MLAYGVQAQGNGQSSTKVADVDAGFGGASQVAFAERDDNDDGDPEVHVAVITSVDENKVSNL